MSSTGTSSSPNDETWDDWTEADQKATSLFCDTSFASPEEAIAYDKAEFGVDLGLLAMTLDFFERIRLINWIRATKPAPSSLVRLDRNAPFLQDDQYLKPVFQDDSLLQYDFDVYPLGSAESTTPAPVENATVLNDKTSALEAQLYDSQQALEQLKKLYIDKYKNVTSFSESYTATPNVEKPRDDDTHYFESYSYNEIHEIMLKDQVRTDAYKNFILGNPSLFKDAIVLDVGCGTGILSMFAAKSGARKVYAVDASTIAHKAERNIKVNGLGEIITVLKGKIENLDIPEKVDIIISEWMGYFLLYECMLDSVLSARDRFMSPNGLMVPSQTSILLTLYEAKTYTKDRVDFWSDVYGFNMSAMSEEIKDEAIIEVVSNEEVVSDRVSLNDIHTQTVSTPDLEFSAHFVLTANKETQVRAFMGYFDTYFTTDGRLLKDTSSVTGSTQLIDGEVYFTTGTQSTPTHWKQTMFLLNEPFDVTPGTTVQGSFRCVKNLDNSRELVVEAHWTVSGSNTNHVQTWKVR